MSAETLRALYEEIDRLEFSLPSPVDWDETYANQPDKLKIFIDIAALIVSALSATGMQDDVIIRLIKERYELDNNISLMEVPECVYAKRILDKVEWLAEIKNHH